MLHIHKFKQLKLTGNGFLHMLQIYGECCSRARMDTAAVGNEHLRSNGHGWGGTEIGDERLRSKRHDQGGDERSGSVGHGQGEKRVFALETT